ncbi:hypothetical protein PSA5_07485, partial [Pseudomonas syringae pv. actinidiae]
CQMCWNAASSPNAAHVAPKILKIMNFLPLRELIPEIGN